MKRFTCIASLVFGAMVMNSIAVNAQTIEDKFGVDSVKTLTNASIYTEYVKQKNYEAALPAWRYVFQNAPKFQMTTYVRGEEIMKGMLSKTKNMAYVDTLMMVYDQRIKYFGQDARYGEGYLLGKKGADLARFGAKDVETQKEAYAMMQKGFEMEGDKCHPLVAQIKFYTACELYSKEAKTKEEYVNLYMQMSDYIDAGLKRGGKGLKAFEDAKSKIDQMFFGSGAADCSTLDEMLTAMFNNAPEDVENLRKISSLLKRNECIDLPLYMQVAEKLYSLDPSADAAYSLAVSFLKDQNYDKAEEYLNEAISKSTDNAAKADYYLRLAQLKLAKKEYSGVKKYALELLKINPNSGAAYLLIGKAYAFYAPSYSSDAFERSTVFLVAVDKFARAKQVDESVADEANTLIRTYSQHFPNKQEAFFRSINAGSTVSVGSWIGESTKARFAAE